MLNCKEFVNADEIARGLSPFQPETVSFQAGRIMLFRIQELLKGKNDFGFETTLVTKSYVGAIHHAKQQEYTIVLIYFWLESVELAKARVTTQVEKGGHDIPQDVIERSYIRGKENFFLLYKEICDSWIVYDNSNEVPVIVAKGSSSLEFYIYNQDLWSRFSMIQ